MTRVEKISSFTVRDKNTEYSWISPIVTYWHFHHKNMSSDSSEDIKDS